MFENAYDKPLAKGSDLIGNIKRLANHRAAWLAVIIMFMFQFAPGANTPLQFYLTNTLHASDAIYGYYYAVFAGAFIPVYLLYAWLCKRYSLEKLLWWGTIITIPQMIPLVFIHSGVEAVWWALPIGMMGGVAGVAFYDLTMRACPSGLQGTLMMMVDGVYQLSYRGSDVLGSWIYASSPAHGFLYCVIATSTVYALILPLLLLIPRELIATRDGEAKPEARGSCRRRRSGTRDGLSADQMQQDFAIMRSVAMFEKVEILPGAERQTPIADRNANTCRRQRRADMARHVVRALRSCGDRVSDRARRDGA